MSFDKFAIKKDLVGNVGFTSLAFGEKLNRRGCFYDEICCPSQILKGYEII